VTVLDKKLLRDLRRLWAQALAIALVMSAGVATFVLAAGARVILHPSDRVVEGVRVVERRN
jgi:putative ABC transport system permease protein